MRVCVTGASGWIGSAVVPEVWRGFSPARSPRRTTAGEQGTSAYTVTPASAAQESTSRS